MAALYQRVSSSGSTISGQALSQNGNSFIKIMNKVHWRREVNCIFDYNPSFCFEVSLKAPSKVNSQAVDGGKDSLIHLHAVALTSGLSPYLGVELTIYQVAHYGGGLFLPFRDDTNGTLSYGGGRYLIDTSKSAWLGFKSDGLDLILIFLLPLGAHNHKYVCPLSPPENTLPIGIEAGEKWGPHDLG